MIYIPALFCDGEGKKIADSEQNELRELPEKVIMNSTNTVSGYIKCYWRNSCRLFLKSFYDRGNFTPSF